jgi:hypothetical protein
MLLAKGRKEQSTRAIDKSNRQEQSTNLLYSDRLDVWLHGLMLDPKTDLPIA